MFQLWGLKVLQHHFWRDKWTNLFTFSYINSYLNWIKYHKTWHILLHIWQCLLSFQSRNNRYIGNQLLDFCLISHNETFPCCLLFQVFPFLSCVCLSLVPYRLGVIKILSARRKGIFPLWLWLLSSLKCIINDRDRYKLYTYATKIFFSHYFRYVHSFSLQYPYDWF